MTEEELEEGITPEILPSNDLAVIIKDTQLEPQLAEEFKINFQQHFQMAAEWAKKAKKIIVTDASQVVVMQEARQARLFLREKRLEIEKFRVARKEYFLKGGRAIDKVANFLKDTIIPIEEHLDRQEHFVELRKAAEDKRILDEAYAKQEAERIAKEAEDAKEKERLRAENEKLRKQAEAAENELRLKRQAEEKVRQEEQRQIQIQKNGTDVAKIQKIHDDILKIEWPDVVGGEEKRLIGDLKSYVGVGLMRIKEYLKTNAIEEET